MSWICPKCSRPFKNENQSHSCVRVSEEDHFVKAEPQVWEIYCDLKSAIRKFGSMHVSPAKGAIMLKNKSTFLAVKVKRNWIDIEFALEKPHDEFPVMKTVPYSANRVIHFIRLGEPSDITSQIVSWLETAYHLAG